MKDADLDAYIINGNDPHFSEYVPARWKTREWISGFTGSYGRVVVTMEKSALWTDSRYYLQAERELKGSGIILMKERLPDTIPPEEWIGQELTKNSAVGIDGLTLSASEERKLSAKFSAKGITFIKGRDLVSDIWKNQPVLSLYQAFDYSIQFAGISRNEKIEKIRQVLTERGAEAIFISMLDDLAWTFNIRGKDIDYTPLVTGYGYIDQEKAILFIEESKIPDSLRVSLAEDKIEIKEYSSIIAFIEKIDINSIYLDPDRTNSLFYNSLPKKVKIVEGLSIPAKLKSIKNNCEISGMRDAHHRDGVAMVNFLYWIYANYDKEELTEIKVCQKIKEFRSQQKYFIGESFHPIAGYNEHGTIVHYHATSETDLTIKQGGVLLIDSGGQYLDGTTDITRTISLGEVTEKQKADFTLVLKGMIQLAKAVFPNHCKGSSLDILARKALWNNYLDYGHGTGHGVGHFLCVHEGPVSIRQDCNPEPISEGNVFSNEPGVYREGEYGIRIENLIRCKKEKQTAFGTFLSFETLTLCPIDKKLIDKSLLTLEEVNWLNDYHRRIINEIGANLEPAVLKWLETQCLPI